MSLTRVDPRSGQRVPLRPGDLSAVDEYAIDDSPHKSVTLRWRSRLPSDPAFDHTAVIYVIAYRISPTPNDKLQASNCRAGSLAKLSMQSRQAQRTANQMR